MLVALAMVPAVAFAEGGYTSNDRTLYVKGDSLLAESFSTSKDGSSSINIASVSSSDEGVAKVRHLSGLADLIGYYSYWYIDPVGTGTATITLTDTSGVTATAKVTVKYPLGVGR